jgi:hypothetical protein
MENGLDRDDHFDMQMLQDKKPCIQKVSFKDWLEKYSVNQSALADFLGCGIVDMFSMLRYSEGEDLKLDLKEYMNMTKRKARTKLKKINSLRRYHLNKL